MRVLDETDPLRTEITVGRPTCTPSASLLHAVRPIEEGDIESFREAVDSVAREQRYLALTEAPPLESTSEFVRRNIRENNPQYVAVVGDRVVGWCDIIPNRRREIYAHSGVLGMGVLEEARGKGIGEELIRAALTHAQRMGLLRVELDVFTTNKPAIGLYKKVGFVVEGTKRKDSKFADRFEDSHVMALLFE